MPRRVTESSIKFGVTRAILNSRSRCLTGVLTGARCREFWESLRGLSALCFYLPRYRGIIVLFVGFTKAWQSWWVMEKNQTYFTRICTHICTPTHTESNLEIGDNIFCRIFWMILPTLLVSQTPKNEKINTAESRYFWSTLTHRAIRLFLDSSFGPPPNPESLSNRSSYFALSTSSFVPHVVVHGSKRFSGNLSSFRKYQRIVLTVSEISIITTLWRSIS